MGVNLGGAIGSEIGGVRLGVNLGRGAIGSEIGGVRLGVNFVLTHSHSTLRLLFSQHLQIVPTMLIRCTRYVTIYTYHIGLIVFATKFADYSVKYCCVSQHVSSTLFGSASG